LTNNNMVIIPHPPYSPDLAPVILLYFPNWKWNWSDDVLIECLTSKGNCKWYSTALKKMTSTVLVKHRKNDGIAVYIPKETILRKWQPKLSKQAFLFWPSPGTFW
jgi:hypothetical protein